MKNETKPTAAYPNYPTESTKPDDTVGKAPYRTKSRAGNTAEIPDRLPVITNPKYQNALTFNKNGTAHLQILSDTSELGFKDNTLTFRGLPATSTELSQLYTEKGMEKADLSLLRAVYGIILAEYSKACEKKLKKITIYYPDLAKKTGKSPGINTTDVKECVKKLKLFQNIFGIINNKTNSTDILPTICQVGFDKEKHTVSFCSPYITKLIREIHKDSIRTDRNGLPIKKKNGLPQMSPAYSYLVDMNIVKEKNKKAVEIVLTVVTLIEQAGKNIPHIRAKTIIERTPLLSQSLQGQSGGNKNNLLKRAFTKAWELLREKTYLTSVYKDIQLPDPNNISCIPTSSTLDMVFQFPHSGKIKNPQV